MPASGAVIRPELVNFNYTNRAFCHWIYNNDDVGLGNVGSTVAFKAPRLLLEDTSNWSSRCSYDYLAFVGGKLMADRRKRTERGGS